MIEDPRPDLRYDSEDWTQLLTLAEAKGEMVAGVLHGFRCGGLRLHRGAKGWALRPDFDPERSTWQTPEEYAKDREQWLVPYADTIVELLKQLNETNAAA